MPDVVTLADKENARARRLRAIEAVAVHGMNFKEAAAFAGVSSATVSTMMKDPRVQKYIKQVQEAHAQALNIRREDVLRGMLDAIDHAKMMSDPNAELRGWEAIAKIQGYNAPELRIIDLPEDTKRLMETMQQMSDTELAKLANVDNMLELTKGVDYDVASNE